MPGAPGCSASTVAGPPRRFRTAEEGPQEDPDSAPVSSRAQLVGLPLPRHPGSKPLQRSRSVGCVSSVAERQRSRPARVCPRASDTARAGCAGAHKSPLDESSRLVRAASSPALFAEPTPAVGAGPQLSVTELVNLAAKAAELEEKSHSRRLSDPSSGLAKQDLRSSYAGLLAATSQHSTTSRATSSSSSPRGISQQQQAAPQQPSSSRTADMKLAAGDGAAASGSPSSRSGGSPSSSSHRATSGRPPMSAARSGASAAAAAAATAFHDPCFQQQQAHHQHPPSLAAGLGGHHHRTGSSECGSEDSAFASSSLVSSASCSSLCSAASYGSNASTCSTSSGRKGILLRRASTSSTSSGASSPRCAKRVTWRDGQAGCEQELGGAALVAVRMMEDSPEVRRMRRDTWPENPGARRDALEAAAAAAAKQQQQQQTQSSLSRAIELLQEPSKLFDWRDKLKQLQQERRQQRLGMVRAGWQQQQQQLAAAAEGDEEGGEQQGAAVPMEVAATAGGGDAAACNKACGAAALHINAVAASATAASF